MILAPYADYEARALAYSGTDTASTDAADLAQFRIQIEGRLREYWQHTWWPDTMRSEERAYRDSWDVASTYAEGDEVYYPGVNGLVIAGAGTTGANSSYEAVFGETGGAGTKPTFYLNGDTASGYYIEYQLLDDNWVLFGPGGGLYSTPGGEAYPWEAAEWDVGSGASPSPTSWAESEDALGGAGYYSANGAISAGVLPLDDTSWSQVTDIDPPEVAYEQEDETAIGLVRLASAVDPLGAARPRKLPFQLTSTGVRLICDPVPTTVYLWYQVRPPELRGDAYAALSTYAVGDRIYFSSGTGDYRGDYWVCVSATTAAQTPITHPAKWSRVELPRFLLEAVAAGVAADRMRSEGKFEQAAIMENRAMDLLVREHAKLDQMQLQDPSTLRSKAYPQRPVPVF